ncbi:PHIKZ070.1 [Pseudomonas phage phiKZ]|uniref:PHIKZ070.1 n=1 Tax=Pseudomonas phage phiKZ TaxID=2905945 RepID=L7T487_BPDPK|nr:PHIKZ070.1 [Pseudomonas phage phiKZ]AGC26317.1 PHIKZ070.1 [Pseudomonas phage phiKZ]
MNYGNNHRHTQETVIDQQKDYRYPQFTEHNVQIDPYDRFYIGGVRGMMFLDEVKKR